MENVAFFNFIPNKTPLIHSSQNIVKFYKN